MNDAAKRVIAGDILAASRLMRDIDDRDPSAVDALRDLYHHTGRAYIIGVTGAPGSGKSTLVDRLVELFRKEGKGVGIVAVDPTSPFTGGAILGDRVRMQRHATDDGVFIRSLATRGYLGGLTRSTQDVVNVMDAMGKEIILVETVGVGQDEVEIVHLAHTSIVVLVPGMGDGIQAIKAGILEIADIFVVNKADRDGADRTEQDLRIALETGRGREDGWKPPIFRTEAILGKGVPELLSGITEHRDAMARTNGFEMKLKERTKATFLDVLQAEVMTRFIARIEEEWTWDRIIDDLMEKRVDPYSLAEEMLAGALAERRRGSC